MSCNCSAKYDNKVPCCCSQGSPLVCTTTTCADAQICNQTIESNCVIYTGPNIECSGVTTGMTVTEVMDIILEQLNLINCSYCWNVHNIGTGQTEFDYIDADGNNVTYPSIAAGATVQVCGRSVSTLGVTATKIGRCSACPTTTTTIPPNITARCTASDGSIDSKYFKMERTWQQSSYTFVISSMVLDGVEYANGEALIVQSPADLVTSISPIDGLNYIMNISDFLNTAIPSVTAAGWRFYDDMHVIEKPSPTSTYSILIERTQADGIQTNYYYSSQYGFSVDDIDNTYGLYTCEPTVSIYSQTVNFSQHPMNSIVYKSNDAFIGACYGFNETNLADLISMFNSNPPVQSNSCFLAYGTYFDNGDGKVRLQMPLSVYNSLSSNGANVLTLEVIYD